MISTLQTISIQFFCQNSRQFARYALPRTHGLIHFFVVHKENVRSNTSGYKEDDQQKNLACNNSLMVRNSV